jgi:prolyl-tRNA synthetase
VDDRIGVSAGVKFTDAELLGMPRSVVVGRRFTEGYVELRDRAGGDRREVPVDEIVTALTAGLTSSHADSASTGRTSTRL